MYPKEGISGTGPYSRETIDTMAINCYDWEDIVNKKVPVYCGSGNFEPCMRPKTTPCS